MIEGNEVLFSKQMKQLNDAIANETKSSAGDKFETSREMMNQEKSKIADQLQKQNLFKTQLNAIRQQALNVVEFGAFVCTNHTNFFITAALGKIEMKDITFFAISVEAPLFKAMQGKKVGEEFAFRNNVYQIKSIT